MDQRGDNLSISKDSNYKGLKYVKLINTQGLILIPKNENNKSKKISNLNGQLELQGTVKIHK